MAKNYNNYSAKAMAQAAANKAKSEQETVNMTKTMAFTKINYILVAIGFAIVVAGFILMAGDSTTVEQFNPDIFSSLRIEIAPMVTLFGFVFIIFGIAFAMPKFLCKKAQDTPAE